MYTTAFSPDKRIAFLIRTGTFVSTSFLYLFVSNDFFPFSFMLRSYVLKSTPVARQRLEIVLQLSLSECCQTMNARCFGVSRASQFPQQFVQVCVTRLYGCAITPIKITDAPVGRLGRYGRLLLRLSGRFLSLTLRLRLYSQKERAASEQRNVFPPRDIRTISAIPIEHSQLEIKRPTENSMTVYAKK